MPNQLAEVRGINEPYPGLRSFEEEEAFLFFGRETHVDELLHRLEERRLLAVLGNSGSGKSSLVRAGLLPALKKGRFPGAKNWRTCVMHPGAAPLLHLAEALEKGGLGKSTEIWEQVSGSSLGLVRTVRDALKNGHLKDGESVLLLVDQFEELFRYPSATGARADSDEARLFVSMLLDAVDLPFDSIYVVITMRSDYLGECAKFNGLPGALSSNQYLIPQLTRQQVRSCIEEPARLFGIEINKRLVERLLNELCDDGSDLPLLQHALHYTYRLFLERKSANHTSENEIGMEHYKLAGEIQSALNRHANSILESLILPAQPWVERVFRCLTKEDGARKSRNPLKVETLMQVVNARTEDEKGLVNQVISKYSDRENSLLYSEDGILDISHEKLIVGWDLLRRWADDEAKAVSWYQRASDDTLNFEEGKVAPWLNPELSYVQKQYLETGIWNAS